MTPNLTTLPLMHRSLAFTASLTYAEFLERSPELAPIFRNRLREIRMPQGCQDFFVNYPYALHCVLLLAEDSPEMVVVGPVLAAVGRSSPRFSLHLLCDRDNLTSLSHLVDDRDLAAEPVLPLFLLFDDEGVFQGQWGPHPQAAEPYLESWFERHPQYDELAATETPEAQAQYALIFEQLVHEMRVWYNSGLNAECIREVQLLLAGLLDEESTEDDE
jgi:hypothetical protein